jgi:hypothetical protein
MVKKTRTTQKAAEPLPPEKLAPLVTLIRGERVLLDADLATLYGVQTKALNQAVKRNRDRFPADFMFQLTAEEWTGLRSRWADHSNAPPEAASQAGNRSQFVTGPARHRGAAARPYAFTEQGVAMLSSVPIPRSVRGSPWGAASSAHRMVRTRMRHLPDDVRDPSCSPVVCGRYRTVNKRSKRGTGRD